MSDEYDDLSASNSSISVHLKQISHRPNVLSVQVERVANAINDAEKYSYQFNVKIIGLQELNSSETAPKTSSLCVKLFQEMGAEVSILDIDIAHRASTRNESQGPKPVVCKFVRRLAKGKVMEVRQRASQVNPTSIGLYAESELRRARIFNHLTPKKQNLLFEAKKFKERNHYQFCWAKNSTIYLRKDESSCVTKISGTDTLRRLALDTKSLQVR